MFYISAVYLDSRVVKRNKGIVEIQQNSGIDRGDYHQVPSLTKELLAVCIC